MQWHFNDNPVKKEAWCWVARYSDNTKLKQFDDEGQFHQFKEIDQSRLIVFEMVSDKYPHKYVIRFKQGMKLIHYYNNFILEAGSPRERRLKVYVVGYEQGKEKHLVTLMPNGSLIAGEV